MDGFSRRRGRRIRRGAFGASDALLLATIVGLPWFWGGVGLDAYRGAAALIALAAGWALARRGAAGLGLDRRAMWLLPAVLLLAWAIVQVMPFPRAWIARASPKAAAIQERAFDGGATSSEWLRAIEADARRKVPESHAAAAAEDRRLEAPAESPSPPGAFKLSLAPGSTLERASWFAALLLAFLLTCRRASSEERAWVYRTVIFVFFGALAVVGIANRLTAPQQLLWIRSVPSDVHAFGPYVNPSHFAGVMELAVPWLLGQGLGFLAGRPEPRATGAGVALVALSGLAAVAAMLAASKMAAVTIATTSAVLGGIAFARARGRLRFVLAASGVAACLLVAAVALRGPLRGRIEDFEAAGQTANERVAAWTAAARMAADYPWTGSGYGAFVELIPAYLPRGESERWLQLHNDYYEVYLAGGILGTGLVLWLAGAYAWRATRCVRLGASRGRLLATLGPVLGLLALAVHEAVDFNLQIPANALLFVVTAAMCVAPLEREGESR